MAYRPKENAKQNQYNEGDNITNQNILNFIALSHKRKATKPTFFFFGKRKLVHLSMKTQA